MTDMTETVAKAMAVADKGGDYWDVMSEDGDGYGYMGKNEYLVMARAAIAAMFERQLDYSPALDAAVQEFIDDKPKDIIK